MKGNVEERAVQLGEYIAKTNATVRLAANKDVSERLKRINMPLYKEVRKVLDQNKEERHIRGGIATKEKYRKIADKNR